MRIQTIKGTFVYMAELWSFKIKSELDYYEFCVGLCSTLHSLERHNIISLELHDKVNAIIDKFYRIGSVYLWDKNAKGAKQRAAFCHFMSKQRFPLSKEVIRKAALKFNLGVR